MIFDKQEARRPVVEVAPPPPARPRAETPRHAGRLDEQVSLREWVHVVWSGRWLVLAATLGCVALAAAYLFVASPVYRANVLLQVEENRKSLAGLEELSRALGETAPPGDTEMEILRSRMLIGAVVDELKLDVSARPTRFPLVGSAIARRYAGKGPAPAPLGLSSYGWGGERIRLGRIDVSDDLYDVPLRLVALPGERFRVSDPDGIVDLEGEVGKVATAENGSTRIELFVETLVARPDTEFELVRRRRIDVVEGLQKGLRIEERRKATGILTVSLDGPDPRRTAATLDAIANTYVKQNVQRKSAETSQTLEFLETQLPGIKATLEEAQSALNDFQVKKGTVDLTAETQSILQRQVEVERQMTELDMQRSELRQRFTENHPTLASIKEKYEQLRNERAMLHGKMRALPATEVDSARHQRDVKVANELYSVLLNKAQELRLVKSGTVGNVRVLDAAAVPYKPVSPNKELAVGFATLLGLSLGVVGVFVRKALTKGVEDPEEIEHETGLPIYATVPRSPKQGELQRAAGRGTPPILAASDAGDLAIENLRSLRTSLQFALVEARNNVVAIGGPAPGVGKSFIAINLAHVLASTDRKVLLIDADLRRGRLHRYVGESRQPGVSDVLSGSAPLDVAIRRTSLPGLDVLPTGRIPPNPAELLATQKFQAMLAEVSRKYDLVLIDTPPVLAVTDASLVGRLAGVNLLVLRSGEHSIREINLAVKRLAQSGIEVQGAVLNDVRASGGRYGKYGRYQRYEYRSLEND
jgi:tyrosine-protein kinase Etk/Wzc